MTGSQNPNVFPLCHSPTQQYVASPSLQTHAMACSAVVVILRMKNQDMAAPTPNAGARPASMVMVMALDQLLSSDCLTPGANTSSINVMQHHTIEVDTPDLR